MTGTFAETPELSLDESHLRAFHQELRGRAIQSSDVEYDQARVVWNGMIDRRPALIVRCLGVADVIASVRFGRAHQLPLAIRGGGHNVAGFGTCDGGLVIDLGLMKGVQVEEFQAEALGVLRVSDVKAERHLPWNDVCGAGLHEELPDCGDQACQPFRVVRDRLHEGGGSDERVLAVVHRGGAGMGGLAVAATLRRFGMDVRIYEQAPRFARIGAVVAMRVEDYYPNGKRLVGAAARERRQAPRNAGAPQSGSL